MKVVLIQPRELFGPPERQAELLECWKLNTMAGFDHIITPAGRPTFTELFDLCDPEAINVIANSDIYLDAASVQRLAALNQFQALALSRTNVDERYTPALHPHKDSQDVWAFMGRPNIQAPFRMGQPGCDNRLAYLIKQAGYIVSNPAKTIKAYHLHNCAYRSYLVDPTKAPRGANKLDTVPGPYAFIEIT